MSNCTKCMNWVIRLQCKCLSCHTELKQGSIRIKDIIIFWDSRKKIVPAASDHHGPDFSDPAFDKEKFNHNLAGFTLTAHMQRNLQGLPKPEFITSKRSRQKTYLSWITDRMLPAILLSHANLSSSCNTAMDDTFKPAVNSPCGYPLPLAGMHQTVSV